ncbi:ras-like protein [Anaeramoeba ignava]|uniref:Ras-like protein n=1 Tax=Anaeramoeba ignava TaxID=1746090 RepID=A0A9Q0R685_ANAIG|nr:ras-like protein [Anaeramoeba ignava]
MFEDNPLKIVLVGGGSVGKSCLATQFLQGKFIEDYDPTIVASHQKVMEIESEQIHVEIIDTAGQEEYRSARDKYIKLGEGFILVFSIIARQSFVEAQLLHESIRRANNFNKAPVITVANKMDLENERIVSKEEGEELANKYSSQYYETSAKTGKNVDLCFETITKLLKEARLNKAQQPVTTQSSNSKSCCLILW